MILALALGTGCWGGEPPSSPRSFSSDVAPVTGNQRIENYRAAKRALRGVYVGRPKTIYCNCTYDPRKKRASKGCGSKDDRRVNWEHVVPARELGRRRPAWNGHPQCRGEGRKCLRRVDPLFNRMEGDLYNLYPSLNRLNQARGHARPGEVRGESRRFGTCDFEVADGVMEPPPSSRGDVARTYRYMAGAYPQAFRLDPSLDRVLDQWDAADPVDAEECRRAERIARIQGNQNPWVAAPCRAAGLAKN